MNFFVITNKQDEYYEGKRAHAIRSKIQDSRLIFIRKNTGLEKKQVIAVHIWIQFPKRKLSQMFDLS